MMIIWVQTRPQRVNEFRMSRDGHASLVSVTQDGRGFTSNNSFFSMGLNPFVYRRQGQTNNVSEYQGRILKTCYQCHGGPGIYSVNSFTRALSCGLPAAATQMTEADLQREEEMSVFWKEREFEWVSSKDSGINKIKPIGFIKFIAILLAGLPAALPSNGRVAQRRSGGIFRWGGRPERSLGLLGFRFSTNMPALRALELVSICEIRVSRRGPT